MNDDRTTLEDETDDADVTVGDELDDAEITHGDEHDQAVMAADDTGMLSAERQITVFEIAQGEHAGDV